MTETKDGVKTFYAIDRNAWRKWLAKNHQSEASVWLIMYKKETSTPSVYYPEAVEEALCYGWIDSRPNKRDAESYYQFFTKRNPKSNWSKVNKASVERLIQQGLMTEAGMATIELAKSNGTWTNLDAVESLLVPDDLQQALTQNKLALKHFELFPKSSKKMILDWIHQAKRPETRLSRITETVTLAQKNERANHWKKKT
jgi:uncharacterized protein YdeI (YjbR/CyaY-like superfamily)